MAPCTHPGMKRPFGLSKNGLIENKGTSTTNYAAIAQQARSLRLNQFGGGKPGMTTAI